MDATPLPRALEASLRAALADTPVACLLGPRQCGKTTLARALAPRYGYVSFDDADALAQAQSDPNGFLAALPDRVILDEIQRVAAVPNGGGLFIAVTPCVEMSWGKQAAECAHAGQWAWMRSDPETVRAWDTAGRPITVVHPTQALWAKLVEDAPVQIHDGEIGRAHV